jgi:hypothetical protein
MQQTRRQTGESKIESKQVSISISQFDFLPDFGRRPCSRHSAGVIGSARPEAGPALPAVL